MKRMNVACLALALTAIWGVTATANDEQIAQQIIERLQQQRDAAQLQDFNIGVQVEKGTVTMMGDVSSPDHANLALDIARRIPGVKLVVNDLNVQGPQTVKPAGLVTEVPQAPPTVRQPTSRLAQTTPAPPVPVPPFATRPAPAGQTFAVQAAAAPPRIAVAQPAAGYIPQAAQAVAVPPRQTIAQPATGYGPQAAQAVAMPPRQNFAQPAVGQAPPAAHLTAQAPRQAQRPLAFAQTGANRRASYVAPEYAGSRPAQYSQHAMGGGPSPVPMMSAGGSGIARAAYDNPQMPGHAWPSYAAYPNYAAVTYPHQYSATAWPYIGPFYPYPQVPLGWRKVMLEWDDGWWFLDFKSK